METVDNKQKTILFTKFKISSAETDMYSRLRPGSLINYLIQSAINSADSLGFGFKNLSKQNLFWVLSRMNVEIYFPLHWYDELTVETWPKDINGILYIRDFIIRNFDDDIVAKATSGWLPINTKTKRPTRIADSTNFHLFTDLKDKHALKEKPEKLNGVSNGDIFDLKSTYFDIDLNKHVTSTRYIDWMVDTFSLQFHQNNYPKKIFINYIKETGPLEKISLIRENNLDKVFSFEGINHNKNNTAFRGRIEF